MKQNVRKVVNNMTPGRRTHIDSMKSGYDFANLDISNSIDLSQESCCFGNQDSISSHNLELDQYPIFDKLESYHFNEIELEYESDQDP